jgi:hypothetical protein
MPMMASHLSGGKVLDRRHVLDARAIDQNIQAAKFARREGDQIRDLVRLEHVGAVIEHGHAIGIGETLALFFDFIGIAQTIEHDVGAVRRQSLGQMQADAG